jgi:hypothetical protein
MVAHAFCPYIPYSVIPVLVKAFGHLMQLRVCPRLAILPQLLQSELRLRCAVRMVKALHPVPDNRAAALSKARLLACQGCQRLLRLCQAMAGLLQEAPTLGPSLLGPCEACRILRGFPACLALPAV